MKAKDILVGMVIDFPDWRGYKVVSNKTGPMPGYVTLRVHRVDAPLDQLTHMVTANTELGVIA